MIWAILYSYIIAYIVYCIHDVKNVALRANGVQLLRVHHFKTIKSFLELEKQMKVDHLHTWLSSI